MEHNELCGDYGEGNWKDYEREEVLQQGALIKGLWFSEQVEMMCQALGHLERLELLPVYCD